MANKILWFVLCFLVGGFSSKNFIGWEQAIVFFLCMPLIVGLYWLLSKWSAFQLRMKDWEHSFVCMVLGYVVFHVIKLF